MYNISSRPRPKPPVGQFPFDFLQLEAELKVGDP